MAFSVYFGDSIAQSREDYPSAREALEAARDFKRRGARGVFVTDGAGRELSEAELEQLSERESH